MAPTKRKVKYKKAPGAPIRFKSSYILYSIAKQKEIRSSAQQKIETRDVARMVAQEWKSLSPEQRLVWEDMSNKDKERYEREKATYTGPWKVPSGKDHTAPKRPMSAFFDFGNSRRAQFRKLYPKATNGEISSMLAKVWKEAPYEVKKEYIEREARLREQYKRDIAAWTEAQKRGPTPPSEQGDNMLEDEDPTEHEESERPVLVKSAGEGEGDDSENDKKPPAVERKSQIQDQETSSNNTGHIAPRLGDAVQPVDDNQHNDITNNNRQSKYVARRKESSDTSFSSDEKSLAPLTSTDIGGFLAAAAMLDAPDQGNSTHRHHHAQQHNERIDKLLPSSSTTGAAAAAAGKGSRGTMKSSVRKVVAKLPPESMQDEDLPKIPSPPTSS